MPLPPATAELYTTLQRYQLMLLVVGRRLWKRMLPDAMDASWQPISQQLVAFTAGAQLAAAQAANVYVPAVLAEQGLPDSPLVRVRPRAFSGVASDGRSLAGLLEGAKVHAKLATMPRETEDDEGNVITVPGKDGGDALADGQRWLEQALHTAVADAARDAVAANIVARPKIGWIRVVNPPCCSRCAVLGGTFYAWNKPMLRHPQCDCEIMPCTEEESAQYLTSPQKLYEQGAITDLSRNQKARLDDGADLVKVLNESRDRWRERMAADRRAERYANYSPAEQRAADRRAGRRAGNGLVVPTGWAGGANPPPAGTTIHELMARLTDQVQAGLAMKAAGLAD